MNIELTLEQRILLLETKEMMQLMTKEALHLYLIALIEQKMLRDNEINELIKTKSCTLHKSPPPLYPRPRRPSTN
jgi:hypothetical protein